MNGISRLLSETLKPGDTDARKCLKVVSGPYATEDAAGERVTDRAQSVWNNGQAWYVVTRLNEDLDDDEDDDGDWMARGGSHTPGSDHNPFSEAADRAEDCAKRVAGLVNRRMNLNLSSPWAKQQIQRVTRAADLLANVAEELDR